MMLQTLPPNGFTSLDWPEPSSSIIDGAQGACGGRHARSVAHSRNKAILPDDLEHHQAAFRDYVPDEYRKER